ncbi:MAG: NAD(+) synthase, partial [Vallitaleaceae bacterium]|nr:NAD(+) synthase [Vallitaleaceae bacterium]
LVRYLVDWVAFSSLKLEVQKILSDILDTPVSPELLPPDKNGNIQQKTEEVVGPYELHDFFLYQLIRYGFTPTKIQFLANSAFMGVYTEEIILKWLKVFYKRFFSQQFKRSCMPDGPKVGSICLSPRGDFRMPSDADVSDWLKALEG